MLRDFHISNRYKDMYFVPVIVFFTIVVAKISPAINLDITITLILLGVSFISLSFLNPPVAVALLISSQYLLGHISVANPGTSVISIVTVITLVTLLLLRATQINLMKFINLDRSLVLAVVLLFGFFLLGFSRAIYSQYTQILGVSGEETIFYMLTNSIRGRNDLLHYEVITHWFSYILLGMFACTSGKELKNFLIAISILYIVNLITLPMKFWNYYFEAVFIHCEAASLSLGNVNRTIIGYFAAIATAVSLTMFLDSRTIVWKRSFFVGWFVFSLYVVILAGSKGPLIAVILAIISILILSKDVSRKILFKYASLLVVLVVITQFSGLSLLPCGSVKHYSVHIDSYYDRVKEIKRVNNTGNGNFVPHDAEVQSTDTNSTLADTSRSITSTLSNNKVAVTEPKYDLRSKILVVLFGDGFGASTRVFDPKSGELSIQSGTLNLLLDFYIETGIIGLIILISALSVLIYKFYLYIRDHDNVDSKLLVPTSAAILVLLVTKSMTAAESHSEMFVALFIGVMMGSLYLSICKKGSG